MKITEVKMFMVGHSWKNWLFLKLYTDSGIHGVSEATPGYGPKTVQTAIEELGQFYLGADPFGLQNLLKKMFEATFITPRGAMLTAISAIEIACWDIIAKSLKTPLHNLFGGRLRDEIRVYANGWYKTSRDPESFAEKAREVVTMGYTALKFDPFGTAFGHIDRREKAEAIELVGAVREAVGQDVDIIVEGHGRFYPESAVSISNKLEKYDVLWFEEPVLPHRILDSLAKVSSKTNIPIAVGERMHTKYEFAELLTKGIVDIVQPDVLHAGGILETIKIAAIAEAHQVTVAPHNAQGPVSTAVCIQMGACLPNFLIQESFEDFDVPWRHQIVDTCLVAKNGYMEVPQRPGLGIDLNEEEIKNHPQINGAFLPLFESGWEKRDLR